MRGSLQELFRHIWRRYWPIFLLVGLAIPPFFWLKHDQVISITDFFFPLNLQSAWQKSWLVWDQTELTGSELSTILYVPRFLFFNLALLLQKIGFSLSNLQSLFLFLSLFLPSLGMYLLMRELDPKRPVSALVASSFIIYNPYMLAVITDTPVIMRLIFTPFAFWLALRAIRLRQPVRHGIGLGLLFFVTPLHNPSTFSVNLTVLAVGLVALVIWLWQQGTQKNQRAFGQFLLIGLVSSLIFASRWLYSTYIGVTSGGLTPPGGLVNTQWAIGTSAHASFSNVIRLLGAWDWFEKFRGDPYLPFAPNFLANKFIGFSLYLIPLLSLAGLAVLAFVRRQKLAAGALFIALLCSAVLAMGMYYQVRPLFAWLFEHVPFFWLFRSPWYKFSLVLVFGYSLCLSILFGWLAEILSQRSLYQRLRLRIQHLPTIVTVGTVTLIISLFIIISYPLFLGQRFWTVKQRTILPASTLTLPSYVQEFANWMPNQPPGRLAGVDQILFESTRYSWGYGDIRPFILDMTGQHGFIYNNYNSPSLVSPLIEQAKQDFWKPNGVTPKILNLLGVRYLLIQRDTYYDYFNQGFNSINIEGQIKTFNYPLIKQFNEWLIHENSAAWPETFITNGLAQDFTSKRLAELPTEPIAFTETTLSGLNLVNNLKQESQALLAIEDKPTRHRFNLDPASNERLVVFGQSWRAGWQAHLNGQELNHLKVNQFANGFIVPKDQGGQLVISYRPQQIMNWLTAFSFTAVVLALIFLIYYVPLQKQMGRPVSKRGEE